MQFLKRDITIDDKLYYGMEIKLPKTTLLIIGNEIGFIMCGALNVNIYNSINLVKREVICANAKGVKTLEDLLNGEIDEITNKACEIGMKKGMKVIEALKLLS